MRASLCAISVETNIWIMKRNDILRMIDNEISFLLCFNLTDKENASVLREIHECIVGM